MPCLCGSLRTKEEDDYDVLWPFPSTSPRKPIRKGLIFGSRRRKNTTNPYADRGLDKFEALLDDLDKKRQEILTQKGSEDVSMVKFIYKGPNEVKPIVVKLRDHRKHDNTSSLESTPKSDHQKDVVFLKRNSDGDEIKERKTVKLPIDESKKIMFDEWGRKLGEGLPPSFYFPLFVTFILVLLLFWGRSFAILCISLGWYLMPIVNESLHNSTQRMKITRKEYIKQSRRTGKKSKA